MKCEMEFKNRFLMLFLFLNLARAIFDGSEDNVEIVHNTEEMEDVNGRYE